MAAKVMVMFTNYDGNGIGFSDFVSLWTNRDGLWEICLCTAFMAFLKLLIDKDYDLDASNLQAGYDLYRKETWDHLRALRRRHRPRRPFGIRCLVRFWCPWTSLNYAGPETSNNFLKDHRRRERRVSLACFMSFLSEGLS